EYDVHLASEKHELAVAGANDGEVGEGKLRVCRTRVPRQRGAPAKRAEREHDHGDQRKPAGNSSSHSSSSSLLVVLVGVVQSPERHVRRVLRGFYTCYRTEVPPGRTHAPCPVPQQPRCQRVVRRGCVVMATSVLNPGRVSAVEDGNLQLR